MPLGIKPTVDFAFKKIFGTPENAAALLGLLNATLDWERSIEKVGEVSSYRRYYLQSLKD